MIEKKQMKNGLYYFVIKHSNGQIIVESEGYSSEVARDSAIETLKKIVCQQIL